MKVSKKNHEHQKNDKNIVSKTLITLLVALIISISSFAQQGRGMNYKAVIKDASGNLLVSQPVNIRFSILQSDSNSVYAESHNTTTDANGIIVVTIGEGNIISGDFLGFNWANDLYQLQTEIDTEQDGTFEFLSTSQFNAVPYAYSSMDNLWQLNNENAIAIGEKVGIGESNPNAKLDVNGDLILQLGTAINEFSTDGTFTDNSNSAVPTEKAVKTYVDANGATGLEKITEEGNTGWRLKGRDPNNYGLIGKNAIDLSYQQHPSETRGATGTEAFTSGWETEASGVRSVAMGYGTIASEYASTALGSYNVDGEHIIFSVGHGSESVRHNALTLTAYDEFIIGSSQIDNDPTSINDDVKFFFDGRNGAFRAGKVSLASGDEWNKDNLGLYSVAFGVGTKASGNYSSAMGSDTNASGISSTALGDNTNAIGLHSIAMGTGSTATGHYSTAMGNNTNAIGLYSSAMGLETIAVTESSIAMGKYNTADIDGLFIIGNGTGTSAVQRKNALIVRTNGDSQFSGEIQRTTTGSSNMVPIAYGTIESNANELSGTGNFSATIAAGIITITVDNEALTFNNSSCSIIPYGIGFRSSSITYTNNKLNVYIFNSSGTLTPTTFQFVIYKL